MVLLDTQIISYAFKKYKDFEITGNLIPSVVAIEFLLMQSEKPHLANYYIPKVGKLHYGVLEQLIKIDHPFRKSLSDSIIFDFGQLHYSFVMFSNFSVAELINNQNIPLFDKAISYLDKDTQKGLKKKIRFLIDSNITCEPIIEEDIVVGYELLKIFLSQYKTKENFRNTWNDILILSKSVTKKLPLITEDKLLNRFAAEWYNVAISNFDKFLKIDFSKSLKEENKVNNESKGYINTGWRYKIIKNYAP